MNRSLSKEEIEDSLFKKKTLTPWKQSLYYGRDNRGLHLGTRVFSSLGGGSARQVMLHMKAYPFLCAHCSAEGLEAQFPLSSYGRPSHCFSLGWPTLTCEPDMTRG